MGAAQKATKAGASDVARRTDATKEPTPDWTPRVWTCCECGKPHTEVYGSWENGKASVCSKTCNIAKTATEKARPHYWPSIARQQLRVV